MKDNEETDYKQKNMKILNLIRIKNLVQRNRMKSY